MRAFNTNLWASAGTVVIGLALMLSSSRSPAQTPAVCSPAGPSRIKQEKNRFEPELEAGTWLLRYGFRDALGKDRQISCRVSDAAHRKEKDEFGLFLCTDQERKERKSKTLAACLDGNKILPLAGSGEAFQAYLQRRGFHNVKGQQHLADYSGIAVDMAEPLQECARALDDEIGTQRGHWLAFFQAMRPDENEASLEVRPYETAGGRTKYNDGLLLPTEVMIQNRGDCDSKAVAFCSLQRNHQEKWAIFRSTHLDCGSSTDDGHAFLALEHGSTSKRRRFNLQEVLSRGWPVNSLAFEGDLLTIGFLRYTVMDVTGPGRTDVGELDPTKYGHYIGIPVEPGPRPGQLRTVPPGG